MKIAMLAPPWIPVPPRGYGGIEQVIALLTGKLTERGNNELEVGRRARHARRRSGAVAARGPASG